MTEAEEVVEVAAKVAFQFKPMVLVAASVVSLAAGVNIGLFIGNRRLKTKYEEYAAKEIAEARLHYARLHKQDEYATPEKAAAALLVEVTPVEIPEEVVEVIREYGGDPRPQLSAENIFQRDPIPERTLVETSEKFTSPVNPNGPYVITEDEFNDNEVGYNQVSLTYYAGDDILADEQDAPILEETETVGDALMRFGEGVTEGGENIVFVRNTKIELDFEVTRSHGKYSVEVAGMDDDTLQHSYERIPRRRYLRDE